MTEQATIGHNSAGVGEMLAEKPELLFTEGGMLDTLIEEIETEISAHEPDLDSDKGRKAIASLAYSIAKRKTALDNAGKELNEEHRKAINAVDAVRKRMRDSLDELKDRARLPLTEWEKAEEDRKDRINQVRDLLARRPAFGASADEIQAMIDSVKAADCDSLVLQDLTQLVLDEQSDAIEQLQAAHRAAIEAEQQRAALEQMRQQKEAEEKRQREQAEKAEAEAREKARIEAAEKAAAERAAAAERQKAQDAIDTANRERAAAEAKLRAEEERKASEAREEAARQADKEHRSAVMKSAKEAIMEHGDVSEDRAKAIVLAIVAGSVPHVTLRF